MYSGRTPPRPIDVAISLGLYMAERNKGPLKDYFLTFSERPEIVKIKGATLKDRIEGMKRANWGCNTNLLLVFQVFLDIVQNYNLSVEEIPKKLFIISDMQFDSAVSNSNKTTFENIEEMFKKANVQRPDLIFWNVNAHSDTPVTSLPLYKLTCSFQIEVCNTKQVAAYSSPKEALFPHILQTPFPSLLEKCFLQFLSENPMDREAW